MNGREEKASKGTIKLVLTLFVIGIIVAVAYLTFFTPGKVAPPNAPATSEGAG